MAQARYRTRPTRPVPIIQWQPPGLLRAGRLRPVQCADPATRLPRGRPALAAATDDRRSAGPQARVCRLVASPCQCTGAVAGARTQDPFRLAGTPAASAPRRSHARCATGAGVDLRRPGAEPQQRLVLGAVLGKLDDRRPLPPLAGDPAQRPRHPGPVRPAGVAARHRRRRAAARTHRAQAVARAAHALPAPARSGGGPRPVDPAHAGGLGAGLHIGARCHRRPGQARQEHARGRLAEGAGLRLRDRRRLFAPGGALGELHAHADLEPDLPRRAGPPPGRLQAGRARP